MSKIKAKGEKHLFAILEALEEAGIYGETLMDATGSFALIDEEEEEAAAEILTEAGLIAA